MRAYEGQKVAFHLFSHLLEGVSSMLCQSQLGTSSPVVMQTAVNLAGLKQV